MAFYDDGEPLTGQSLGSVLYNLIHRLRRGAILGETFWSLILEEYRGV